ncbi:MAG: glycosyl hydrolase family 5, partial [Cyanobacteria bacterium REEB65]|nr:glycosyl hydrolase family 5 [Cyanobacteria bacterium REEB65]
MVGFSFLASLLLATAAPGRVADWQRYAARFILPEGRVVDTGNGGISHSEGQAYAMLLATYHDDPDVFNRVWNWTRSHLQVRADALCAWKWTQNQGVADMNNATDGDLMRVWAFERADARWPNQGWGARATLLAKDIAGKLVKTSAQGPVLLPGVQ